MVEEAKARASEEGAKIIAAAKAEAEQEAVKAREALREQVAGWRSRAPSDPAPRGQRRCACRAAGPPEGGALTMAELAPSHVPTPRRCSRPPVALPPA
jgi:hypothetical protein